VQRGHRHVQEPDHGARRGRAGRCRRLSRLQRAAHRPRRLLVLGDAAPAPAVVGRDRAVAGHDARVRPATADARDRGGQLTSAATADPRRAHATTRRGMNLEMWGWVYMRVSGVLLTILIFGHLFVILMVGEGIHGIDFAIVAGKFATPFWQW